MAFVPDAFLAEQGLRKGDATPLGDGAAFRRLKEAAAGISSRSLSQCGGCSCNTAKVLACLGCQTFFCGCVGGDAVGSQFREALCQLGMVDLCPQAADRDSGEVLCLVAEDGERSFAYRTGVASDALESGALSAALDQDQDDQEAKPAGQRSL
ncbi:gsk [Symbiodinium natans]|uniref:Gsk protein n=1 Tax=Symbiodinium natans TaxID=878477 RepID=A0A812TF13_9DINO|nr:gsk [Symbiodinium natans]